MNVKSVGLNTNSFSYTVFNKVSALTTLFFAKVGEIRSAVGVLLSDRFSSTSQAIDLIAFHERIANKQFTNARDALKNSTDEQLWLKLLINALSSGISSDELLKDYISYAPSVELRTQLRNKIAHCFGNRAMELSEEYTQRYNYTQTALDQLDHDQRNKYKQASITEYSKWALDLISNKPKNPFYAGSYEKNIENAIQKLLGVKKDFSYTPSLPTPSMSLNEKLDCLRNLRDALVSRTTTLKQYARYLKEPVFSHRIENFNTACQLLNKAIETKNCDVGALNIENLFPSAPQIESHTRGLFDATVKLADQITNNSIRLDLYLKIYLEYSGNAYAEGFWYKKIVPYDSLCLSQYLDSVIEIANRIPQKRMELITDALEHIENKEQINMLLGDLEEDKVTLQKLETLDKLVTLLKQEKIESNFPTSLLEMLEAFSQEKPVLEEKIVSLLCNIVELVDANAKQDIFKTVQTITNHSYDTPGSNWSRMVSCMVIADTFAETQDVSSFHKKALELAEKKQKSYHFQFGILEGLYCRMVKNGDLAHANNVLESLKIDTDLEADLQKRVEKLQTLARIYHGELESRSANRTFGHHHLYPKTTPKQKEKCITLIQEAFTFIQKATSLNHAEKGSLFLDLIKTCRETKMSDNIIETYIGAAIKSLEPIRNPNKDKANLFLKILEEEVPLGKLQIIEVVGNLMYGMNGLPINERMHTLMKAADSLASLALKHPSQYETLYFSQKEIVKNIIELLTDLDFQEIKDTNQFLCDFTDIFIQSIRTGIDTKPFFKNKINFFQNNIHLLWNEISWSKSVLLKEIFTHITPTASAEVKALSQLFGCIHGLSKEQPTLDDLSKDNLEVYLHYLINKDEFAKAREVQQHINAVTGKKTALQAVALMAIGACVAFLATRLR